MLPMNYGLRGFILFAAGLMAFGMAFVSWTFREVEEIRTALAILAKNRGGSDFKFPTGGDEKAKSALLTVDAAGAAGLEGDLGPLATYLRHVKIVDNRDGKRGPLTLKRNETQHQSEGQPAAIHKHFKGKKDGTFLEAGANDGEFQSSTLLLERDHGWRGILVEPVPWLFPKVVATNRRAMMLEGCISPKPYPYVAEMRIGRPTGDEDPYSHIDKMAVNSLPETAPRAMVDCYPLYDVLKAAGLTKLDVLCLDVQGPELQILETVPWHLVDIQLLVLENDYRDQNAQDRLFNATATFLASKGYKFLEKVSFDFFFWKETSPSN